MKLRITYAIICLGSLLVSCGAPPEDDGGFITSSGGEEEIDSLELPLEYDLLEQPLSISLFFELTNEQIGSDYCYNEDEVKNLLMGDGPDEYTWTSKEISERYLMFENQECYVTTEFVIRGDGEYMYAILLQSGKNGQQMNVFDWNEGGREWSKIDFPQPRRAEFYADLSESDYDLVKEFGYFYGYMEDEGARLKYVFSTWQMGLNADGKEIMSFNKEPDFSFELMDENEGGFWLKKNYENSEIIPERYFLAYAETNNVSDDFSYFSEQIGNILKDDGVISSFAAFEETDYKGFFPTDTFDFSAMKQFEPRNGYWLFERGKEPLDLEFDMVDPTLEKARRYFYEK